jgi:hypothetical protein
MSFSLFAKALGMFLKISKLSPKFGESLEM